jgi:hypothetical protein
MLCSEAHIPYLLAHTLRLPAKLDDHLQILEGRHLQRTAPEVVTSRLAKKNQENLPLQLQIWQIKPAASEDGNRHLESLRFMKLVIPLDDFLHVRPDTLIAGISQMNNPLQSCIMTIGGQWWLGMINNILLGREVFCLLSILFLEMKLPRKMGHKKQLNNQVQRSKSSFFSCRVRFQECMGST